MWRDVERRANFYGFNANVPAPYPLKEFDLANQVAILGKKEGLSRFTRSDLKAFVRTYFTKDNLVVSFVGDVSFGKVKKWLDKFIQEMPEKSKHLPIRSCHGKDLLRTR